MTEHERNVLAFVVIDPDAWYSHGVETFGEEVAKDFLADKVSKWESAYQDAVTKPNYKTRAQRGS